MKQVALLVGLLCFVEGVVAGSGCVLVAKGQAAVTFSDGRAISLPSRLPDCTGVKVASGAVLACFLDNQGARQCRTLQRGEDFRAEALGAASGDDASGFKATMANLLKGDAQVRAGQTRAVDRHPGLPFGSVAAPSGSLPLQPALALGSFKRGKLTVRAMGLPAWEQTWDLEPSTSAIPAKALEPGREYAWAATLGDRSAAGRFRYASADEIKRLQEDLLLLKQRNGGDSRAIAVLGAELFAERGFSYEAAHMLAGLKSQQ